MLRRIVIGSEEDVGGGDRDSGLKVSMCCRQEGGRSWMSVSSCSSSCSVSVCHVLLLVAGSRWKYVSKWHNYKNSRYKPTISLAKSVILEIILTSSYEHPIEGSISLESTGGTSCMIFATFRHADLPRASLTRKNLETNSMT